jgi:hypothetical protein
MSDLTTDIQQLRGALAAVHHALTQHRPELSPYWADALTRLDAMVVASASIEELAQFARTTSSAIGVGMGSLGDTYVAPGFEATLDALGAALERVESRWRESAANPLPLRRQLTELEDDLLAAGMSVEAGRVRELLRGTPDVPTIAALLRSPELARISDAGIRARLASLSTALDRV